MRLTVWTSSLVAMALIVTLSATGCNGHPLDNTRSNAIGGADAGAAEVDRSRPPYNVGGANDRPYDTPSVDVDGDGDRALWSGRNDLNNPPVDIRAQPPAHRASPLTVNGRFAGNGYGDTIANLALSIPGVASSVAVTHGRVIIVGIGLAHRSPKHNIGAIQREMRRRIAVQTPELRYVYVTTDTYQVLELNRIADGLRSGTPASVYLGRMENLMRAMRPIPLY
jgi:hypothetical protein